MYNIHNSRRERLADLLEMLVKRENGDPEMIAEKEKRETAYGDITLLREDSRENLDIKMLHDMGFIRSEYIRDPSRQFSMAGIFAYTITEDGREFLAEQRGARAARSRGAKKRATSHISHSRDDESPPGWVNERDGLRNIRELLAERLGAGAERQATSDASSSNKQDPPTAFISYSWDDESHMSWVKELATRLRKDGIDAKLDQWEVSLGDPITKFMGSAIRESDFIVIICTPRYKERSDNFVGGVGYEESIVTGAVLTNQSDRNKFIPVLRSGEWSDAAPSWLVGSVYADLSENARYEQQYSRLRDTLLGRTETAPPIGGGL